MKFGFNGFALQASFNVGIDIWDRPNLSLRVSTTLLLSFPIMMRVNDLFIQGKILKSMVWKNCPTHTIVGNCKLSNYLHKKNEILSTFRREQNILWKGRLLRTKLGRVRLKSSHLKGQYHLSSSLFLLFSFDESLPTNLPPTYLTADYWPIHPSGWDGSLLRRKAADEVPASPAGAHFNAPLALT